jgi:hypothetical protein
MNLIELNQALKQLRLGGMAAVLATRLQQAQTEAMAPIDLISCLVTDELSDVVIDSWNDAVNKRAFVIHSRPSITSTSASTRR